MIYCAKFYRDHYVLVFDYLSDPSEISLSRGRGELIYCLPEYTDPVIVAACSEDRCASVLLSSGEPLEVYVSEPGGLEILEEDEIRNWKKIHKWWAMKAISIINK